jgi:SSS family solute:Na+ symporter
MEEMVLARYAGRIGLTDPFHFSYKILFMSSADWLILGVTLIGVIAYGLYKSRTSKDLDGYFLGNRTMPWYLILFSIMGTQASAVTFLSVPGQAYTDGMRFVQFYFGLPLAMVVVCATFVPIFHRLKVYTAYEFLEKRFDNKTRTLTSSLFLLQRGLSTGISIYAPSIILSTLLGWNIYLTNIVMGGLLIIYTVTGGAKAVAHTQTFQLCIVFAGFFLAGYMVIKLLPQEMGLFDAIDLGGKLGKMNVITTGVSEKGFDWGDRYNIISGIIGGFFLQLSYFGTDQSQVGRYLTGSSVTESRLGLIMNGIVKIPMQFLILLIGILVFSFYLFNPRPASFNQRQVDLLHQSASRNEMVALERKLDSIQQIKRELVTQWSQQKNAGAVEGIQSQLAQEKNIRDSVQQLLKKEAPLAESTDTNYIFLRFVIDHLPKGIVGLLIAVIFLAAWGSIAAALNSLASSSVVDVHKKYIEKDCSDIRDYRLSKWYTLGWGIFCMITAMFATRMGSLIEAVNILGSLFYGVILGIFLVAFYVKKISGHAVFYSAIISEAIVVTLFVLAEKDLIQLGFLWLTLVGSVAVILIGLLIQGMMGKEVKVVSEK